ncbi:hypothetical protein YDYSY3_23340 [Paenibacillus chitinolyticus]|nr:hypothetical protein YDYSY3_23340 [Paenibacillus chitinolyticus]
MHLVCMYISVSDECYAAGTRTLSGAGSRGNAAGRNKESRRSAAFFVSADLIRPDPSGSRKGGKAAFGKVTA